MTFDLSVLSKPADVEKFYEAHWSDLKGLPKSTFDAHMRSMLHSQRKDYQSDVRFVMTPDDYNDLTSLAPGAPYAEDKLPAIIRDTCAEIVVRLAEGDWVIKSKNGEAGIIRPRGAVQQVAPEGSVSADPLAAKRRPLEL